MNVFSMEDGGVEEIALPDAPEVDVEEGLARVGGKKRLYLDLLRIFIRDYADVRERMDAAFEKEDSETAQRLAHSLKGVAGNIGARALERAAAAAEAVIRVDEIRTPPTLLESLGAELDAVVKALRRAGFQRDEETAGAEPPPGAPAALPVEIGAAIYEAVEYGDSARLKELAGRVMEFDVDFGKKMRRLADNYEYDELLRMIGKDSWHRASLE